MRLVAEWTRIVIDCGFNFTRIAIDCGVDYDCVCGVDYDCVCGIDYDYVCGFDEDCIDCGSHENCNLLWIHEDRKV